MQQKRGSCGCFIDLQFIKLILSTDSFENLNVLKIQQALRRNSLRKLLMTVVVIEPNVIYITTCDFKKQMMVHFVLC